LRLVCQRDVITCCATGRPFGWEQQNRLLPAAERRQNRIEGRAGSPAAESSQRPQPIALGRLAETGEIGRFRAHRTRQQHSSPSPGRPLRLPPAPAATALDLALHTTHHTGTHRDVKRKPREAITRVSNRAANWNETRKARSVHAATIYVRLFLYDAGPARYVPPAPAA